MSMYDCYIMLSEYMEGDGITTCVFIEAVMWVPMLACTWIFMLWRGSIWFGPTLRSSMLGGRVSNMFILAWGVINCQCGGMIFTSSFSSSVMMNLYCRYWCLGGCNWNIGTLEFLGIKTFQKWKEHLDPCREGSGIHELHSVLLIGWKFCGRRFSH